jgi:hypothetical protein
VQPAPPPRWPRPTLPDLHRQRLGIWGLGTGLKGHHTRAQRQVLQRCKAEDAGVGVSAKRWNKVSKQTSHKVHNDGYENENLHLGVNPGLLHWATRQTLLGGCTLSAHRLGSCPTSTRRSDGGVALHGCSGAVLPTSAMAGVGPWPPPAVRETCMSRVASESASCGAHGDNAEPVDLAHDGRLCKESESGWSEPSKRWRDGVARSSDRLDVSAQQGGSLCASEALGPPGAMRGCAAC